MGHAAARPDSAINLHSICWVFLDKKAVCVLEINMCIIELKKVSLLFVHRLKSH